MHRAFVASLLALTASACSQPFSQTVRDVVPTFHYWATAEERIHIVDTASDMRACQRLGEVSPPVTTTPGFAGATQGMLAGTVALGGTHLLLDRRSTDWSVVQGIAYRCGPSGREDTVIRARG